MLRSSTKTKTQSRELSSDLAPLGQAEDVIMGYLDDLLGPVSSVPDELGTHTSEAILRPGYWPIPTTTAPIHGMKDFDMSRAEAFHLLLVCLYHLRRPMGGHLRQAFMTLAKNLGEFCFRSNTPAT